MKQIGVDTQMVRHAPMGEEQYRFKRTVGVGNPQGNLDHLAQHRDMFGEGSPVGSLIDAYLKTGDTMIIPLILHHIEDERQFWLALAGKQSEPVHQSPSVGIPVVGQEERDAAVGHRPTESEVEMSLDYVIKGSMPEERITYGIVYRHSRTDFQNEWAERQLVEKAAHRYLRLYRKSDVEHSWKEGAGEVVESYIAPQRITHYFGKALEPDQVINEGDWVLAVQWIPEEWAKIKNGEITGYSLGGLKRVKEGVAPEDEA